MTERSLAERSLAERIIVGFSDFARGTPLLVLLLAPKVKQASKTYFRKLRS